MRLNAMERSLAARGQSRKSSKVVVDPGPSLPSIVKSAGRVLQIFDLFDEIQRSAKVHEISERLNFPQSSTSVLLKCLTQLGYMDYDPANRTFLPSPRVALLGSWMDNGPVRDGRLVQMMERLSHKTGDTVILAARNGIYADYMRVIQSPAPTHFRVPQGSRRLVVWSATGFALLCHERNELIRALCLRANAEAPDGKQAVPLKRAFENVQQVRRQRLFLLQGPRHRRRGLNRDAAAAEDRPARQAVCAGRVRSAGRIGPTREGHRRHDGRDHQGLSFSLSRGALRPAASSRRTSSVCSPSLGA